MQDLIRLNRYKNKTKSTKNKTKSHKRLQQGIYEPIGNINKRATREAHGVILAIWKQKF